MVHAMHPLPPEQQVGYLRLKDSCITQLKAQGPSRTCNESREEEETLRSWKHSFSLASAFPGTAIGVPL